MLIRAHRWSTLAKCKVGLLRSGHCRSHKDLGQAALTCSRTVWVTLGFRTLPIASDRVRAHNVVPKVLGFCHYITFLRAAILLEEKSQSGLAWVVEGLFLVQI